MSKAKKLMIECQDRNLHCGIAYQRKTDYSVEIYKGYVSSYQKLFYTDGHINLKKAIKASRQFLKDYDKYTKTKNHE